MSIDMSPFMSLCLNLYKSPSFFKISINKQIIYIYIYIYIYVYLYIFIHYLYIFIYIVIYILWEEDDAKQLYLVFKVSCRRTDSLSAKYNDHQKLYSNNGILNMLSFMYGSLSQFLKFNPRKGSLPLVM